MKPGLYKHRAGPIVEVPEGARECLGCNCPMHVSQGGRPIVETTDKLRDGGFAWVNQSNLTPWKPKKKP